MSRDWHFLGVLSVVEMKNENGNENGKIASQALKVHFHALEASGDNVLKLSM